MRASEKLIPDYQLAQANPEAFANIIIDQLNKAISQGATDQKHSPSPDIAEHITATFLNSNDHRSVGTRDHSLGPVNRSLCRQTTTRSLRDPRQTSVGRTAPSSGKHLAPDLQDSNVADTQSNRIPTLEEQGNKSKSMTGSATTACRNRLTGTADRQKQRLWQVSNTDITHANPRSANSPRTVDGNKWDSKSSKPLHSARSFVHRTDVSGRTIMTRNKTAILTDTSSHQENTLGAKTKDRHETPSLKHIPKRHHHHYHNREQQLEQLLLCSPSTHPVTNPHTPSSLSNRFISPGTVKDDSSSLYSRCDQPTLSKPNASRRNINNAVACRRNARNASMSMFDVSQVARTCGTKDRIVDEWLERSAASYISNEATQNQTMPSAQQYIDGRPTKPLLKPVLFNKTAALKSDRMAVLYNLPGQDVPYLTHTQSNPLTLAEFKELIQYDRVEGYRFFFKTKTDFCEAGVVFQEVRDLNAPVPLFDNKVVAKVEHRG